ncbi:MAG TPA: heavy metal-binding domain-containing protein [Solirubrobacteraceae bacterium]
MTAPEDDLARIEAGDIPLAAEQRLKALAGGSTPFSSTLSTAGFALCDRLGLRPLAQVMGSSVYQVGFQPSTYPMMLGGSIVTELETLSDAWNEVRRRALNRMELEARHAGAEAVVSVEVKATEGDLEPGALEYVVTGTAVRREGAPPAAAPALTELSVADYAKLLDAGYEPVGIVSRTSVFFAAFANNWLSGPQGPGMLENVEYSEFTEGVYGAREQVIDYIGMQASQLGASGVVGMRLRHTMNRLEVGSGGGERGGMMITFDAIGTAIRAARTPAAARPKTTIDLSI